MERPSDSLGRISICSRGNSILIYSGIVTGPPATSGDDYEVSVSRKVLPVAMGVLTELFTKLLYFQRLGHTTAYGSRDE